MQGSRKYEILPPDERYCRVEQDEVRFIANRQTLSIVLGSCISTVFIGRGKGYYLAANHIVIAKPQTISLTTKKSAEEQINEILKIYNDVYYITEKDLFCLHLIGAGTNIKDNIIQINIQNIEESKKILRDRNLNILFNDTGSYCVAIFSLNMNRLSVFIEDKLNDSNISYTIDLDTLFKLVYRDYPFLPASALISRNKGFENFVKDKIIISIIGPKDR